ncbi:Floral homeotic protein AGAMOUS [Vitis vinifera]|uniref:Floral homeotic protein AGAMOUS n=1 Tax=Vitis vinifera TaxID=29760 RepID=A0A438DVW0_VITVI|nr:Floral homeotic protein AGAMOUS [Vitis vinifera]
MPISHVHPDPEILDFRPNLIFLSISNVKNWVQTNECNTLTLLLLHIHQPQFYQQEASKLRRQIRDIQNLNRHILGEALSSLNFKELKNLETRLEKGISRIRSKKNELLFAEIEYMQKREIELQNSNLFLRAQIAENERAQQQMNLMPGSQYESVPQQPYDSQNLLPVNLLDPNHHYSRHDKQLSN